MSGHDVLREALRSEGLTEIGIVDDGSYKDSEVERRWVDEDNVKDDAEPEPGPNEVVTFARPMRRTKRF